MQRENDAEAEAQEREIERQEREEEMERESEKRKRKRERGRMGAEDINIICCHYCKQAYEKDRYFENTGKKEICWKCLPAHSYQPGIVRTDYQEMFDELEHGIWHKKNVMHIEHELSDRFVLDVLSGNIDRPEEMAEKIFTFSDRIKEKRRQAIDDEWE